MCSSTRASCSSAFPPVHPALAAHRPRGFRPLAWPGPRWNCRERRTGPLGRGLAKLAAVLDDAGLDTGDITAGVVFDLDRPANTDDLAEYAATGTEIVIDHYSPDRDEVTERTIVPRHLFVESGRWYVVADDGRSGERRTFRIDRIERTCRPGTGYRPRSTSPRRPGSSPMPMCHGRSSACAARPLDHRGVSGRRGHRARLAGGLGPGPAPGGEPAVAAPLADQARSERRADRTGECRRRGGGPGAPDARSIWLTCPVVEPAGPVTAIGRTVRGRPRR